MPSCVEQLSKTLHCFDLLMNRSTFLLWSSLLLLLLLLPTAAGRVLLDLAGGLVVVLLALPLLLTGLGWIDGRCCNPEWSRVQLAVLSVLVARTDVECVVPNFRITVPMHQPIPWFPPVTSPLMCRLRMSALSLDRCPRCCLALLAIGAHAETKRTELHRQKRRPHSRELQSTIL